MSIPLATCPKATKPWPSGLRLPAQPSSAWSPMQRKLEVAEFGERRAIEMLEAGPAGALQFIGANPYVAKFAVGAGLNHFDLDRVLRPFVRRGGSVKSATFVRVAIHIFEQVGGRVRCFNRVENHLYITEQCGLIFPS